MSKPKKIECPYCDGDGDISVPNLGSGRALFEDCLYCNGTGLVTPEHAANIDVNRSYHEILADQKSCADEDKMDARRQGDENQI